MLFEPRHRFAWVAAACFLLLCASLNSDSSSAAAASFPSQNGVENKNNQDENSAEPNIFTTPEMSALRHRGVDPEVNKGDDQGQFLFGGCPSEDVCGGRRLLFLFRRYSLCNAETEPAEICTLFPRRYLRRGYSCGACPTIDRCNSLESALFFPGASFVSSHARGSIQVEWATEAFPYSLSQGDREEHCSDIRYHIILAPGQQNELLNVSRGINVTELLQDASSTNVNNVSVVQTSSPKGHVLENLPPHGNYTLLVVASANQQAIFSDPLTPSASVRVASMHPVLHPHVNRLVQLPTEGNLSVTLSGYVPDQVLVLTLQGRDGSSLPEEVNSLQAQDAVSGIAEGEAGSRQPFLVILDSLMITELEDGVFPTIAWYVRAAAISDVFQTLEFDTTHDLSRVVDPTDLDDESLSSTRRQRNRHLWTREKDLNTPFAPLELELPVPETPLSFKIPIQYSPDLNIRVELEPINLDKLLGDTLYVSVGGFEKWNYGFEINWELFNFDLLKNKPSWKDHTLFRHNIYIPTPVCTILLEGRIKTVGEIKFSGTVKVTANYTEYMSRRQVFVLQFVGPFWFWGPKLMIPLVTMDEYGLVRSKLEDFTLSAEFELSGSFGIGYFVGPKFVSDYFNVGVMGALKLSIAVGHYSRYDFNDNSVEISPYVLDKFDLELVLECKYLCSSPKRIIYSFVISTSSLL